MRIAMIGTGYVGLVSGACFAEFGLDVVCVDKDERKIAMLEEGRIPIFEPGLDTLVARHKEAGRLSFTTDLKAAVRQSEAVFICGRRSGKSDCGVLRCTSKVWSSTTTSPPASMSDSSFFGSSE